MPVTRSFEKDIFISYCHADNEDVMGLGWIELFNRALRERLVQLLGARTPEEEPAIWRDDELQGNDEFADVLSERLREVALVVSVMSPSYVKSDWCKREIAAFCKAAAERGGIVIGHKGRILKVLKDPVPREAHPEVLQGQTGFPFYRLDPGSPRPIPFTLTPGDETIALAKRVINDLAYSIIETLKAVNEVDLAPLHDEGAPADNGAGAASAVALARTAPGEKAAEAGTVYLADSDLDEARREVRRALEAHGIRVLPAGELPLRKAEDFKRQVREALQASDLAVHMVAARRSMVLAGEVEDTVCLQNQIAAEISAEKGLARLIWLPPGLQVADDDAHQQRFVESLHADHTVQHGAELLKLPLQDLIARIREKLAQRVAAKAAPPRPMARSDTPPQVYLITDEADVEAVDPLRQQLSELGFDVVERLSDDSTPEEKQADHRRNLVGCDAAILFVGEAGENWTKTLIGELQKANGWRDPERPLRSRAIYLGPPAKPFKAKYLHKVGFESLDGREGLAAAPLRAFLDQVQAGAEGGV